ncbi:hypothetical protein ACWGHD_04315 [Streptomyces xanthophaeus]
MSAYDWCAIAAVTGLITVIAWYSCGPAAANDQAAWDASTAARTEADVQEDLAKARAALDFATCIAIWQITPHDIPQQTRHHPRTEEDQ